MLLPIHPPNPLCQEACPDFAGVRFGAAVTGGIRVIATLALVMLTGMQPECFAEPSVRSHVDAERGWSRFHGDDAHGMAAGVLPDKWSADDYEWSTDLGSVDVGSPVLNSNSVYLAASGDGAIDLVCLDVSTGEERWRRSHDFVDRRKHSRNTIASTTPALDSQRVYFVYADAEKLVALAYDHAGDLIWKRQLGSWVGQHGFGSSPVVYQDNVYIFDSQQVDQLEPGVKPGDSRMLALDSATGVTRWSTQLAATRPCYGVPYVYESESGPTQLVAANKGNGLFGLRLNDGQLMWSLSVFDKRCCSTPVVVEGVAFGSCGSGGGGNQFVGVKIPANGEDPQEVLRIDRNAPYVPSPAVADRLMLLVADRGIATCVDTRALETRWSIRLGGNFGASPVVIGEKALAISLDGEAHTIPLQPERPNPTRFHLGGPVGATPAIQGGRLILRIGPSLCSLRIDS
ncbi:MAG: PQQ-binding-like beta-propeller repeat protein [Planctomycetota bacterium]